MNLNYWEKQFILYAKGHFKSENFTEDIKAFPAGMYGLSSAQVQEDHVMHMVFTLFEKLIENGHIQFKLSDFLSKAFGNVVFERGKNEVGWDDLFKVVLSEVRNMNVRKAKLDLGSPDENILHE